MAQPVDRASPGPRSSKISTFYTIIKQWEFDHFELLDFCVPSNSTSSDSNSTSKASYGSCSVVCMHRTYSVAKGSATMYALCVQRGEGVKQRRISASRWSLCEVCMFDIYIFPFRSIFSHPEMEYCH